MNCHFSNMLFQNNKKKMIMILDNWERGMVRNSIILEIKREELFDFSLILEELKSLYLKLKKEN